MDKSVLVIGGGIAGIQASLDLAERRFKVHLVELKPSLGGVVAQLERTFPNAYCSICSPQLGKTFPNMYCSTCVLAPRMMACLTHPNLKLHTLSEVVEVTGSAGAFHVKILEKPRYVDSSRCTGCGTCTEECPVQVPNEYQAGLGMRKAIYIPFQQAVPPVATIDIENCIQFQKGTCRACEGVCGAGAIDYQQKPRKKEIDVSSIIVATGFELYNPLRIGEYGYKRFPNVITALEFERLASTTGPTGGKLERPSDKKIARRIAFIHCVGSRSHKIGVPYCSSVCCVHASKEAVLVRERDPESEVTVFYIDLRVFGKGYQQFIEGARDKWGVRYIRGRPGEIQENPLTKDLTIWYEDADTSKIGKMELDLIVLCTAMIPRPENKKLAGVLGVDLDEFGFFKIQDPISNPNETSVPGVYVCGFCHGPRDIPESVTEGSAAAARAAENAQRAVSCSR